MGKYATWVRDAYADLIPYFLTFNGTRDLGRGTAFPSVDITLAAGDRFFRTDLNFACVYDGTRWLTSHEYSITLTPNGRAAQPYAGGAGTLLFGPIRTDYLAYYTRAKVYLDVLTTNNGTNYWSFTVAVSSTTVWSFNTSADSPGAQINKEDSTAAATTGGTFAKLDVASKTGAPGNVVINATLWYRLMIT